MCYVIKTSPESLRDAAVDLCKQSSPVGRRVVSAKFIRSSTNYCRWADYLYLEFSD